MVPQHVRLNHEREVRALLVQLARIVARAVQALLLARKRANLDVLPELDALARNDACDAQQRRRARPVVVPAWCAHATERPAAVVVRTDEHRLRRVLRALVRAALSSVPILMQPAHIHMATRCSQMSPWG